LEGRCSWRTNRLLVLELNTIATTNAPPNAPQNYPQQSLSAQAVSLRQRKIIGRTDPGGRSPSQEQQATLRPVPQSRTDLRYTLTEGVSICPHSKFATLFRLRDATSRLSAVRREDRNLGVVQRQGTNDDGLEMALGLGGCPGARQRASMGPVEIEFTEASDTPFSGGLFTAKNQSLRLLALVRLLTGEVTATWHWCTRSMQAAALTAGSRHSLLQVKQSLSVRSTSKQTQHLTHRELLC